VVSQARANIELFDLLRQRSCFTDRGIIFPGRGGPAQSVHQVMDLEPPAR